MVAHLSLTRLPVDNAVVATHVDIDCSGLDPAKSVQFLINGTVRATIPVNVDGDATLLYTVPPGQQRNALRDLGHGEGSIIDAVDGVNLVHVEADGDSMSLRYAA